ncbi:hypothetical protein FG386_002857 [Cryptosporidium ryanae]|uniref:uncharacterized protein n=1 Tax=Cryptosporidium ryanae TaxID=515981 RepID=UPI00351A51D7|nr:hypothetical protein FG386_002857 [Cryptosporidium ryanae]
MPKCLNFLKLSNNNQYANTKNCKHRYNFNFDLSKLFIIGFGFSSFLLAKLKYDEYLNTVTLQEFVNLYLSKDLVEKVVINKEKGKAILKSNHSLRNANKSIVYFSIGDLNSFENKMKDSQVSMGKDTLDFVPIKYSHLISLKKIVNDILPTIVGITLILLFIKTISKMSFINGINKNSGNNNSSPGKLFKLGISQFNNLNEKNVIKFSNIAGMNEAKKEIYEIVEFLKDPKKFEILGAKIPRGALLVGPPGTGKTLLAKAVAGEANVPFYYISGSDFIEIFIGMGSSRVRELFSKARKHAPSIVFIDEIDAVGRKRSKNNGISSSNDERESTLNQILVEMDGFADNNGVIVLAGTNRPDILDPALTRPGRFDRIIKIDKPTLNERKDIFNIYIKPLKLNNKLNKSELINYLASISPGFVGSEIKNLCNEAAILAARRSSSDGVDIIDFDNASDKIICGLKKTDGYLSPKEKKIVSFHESGHAIASWFLKHSDPIIKISIVPRNSGALGFTQMNPNELKLLSKNQILDRIAVLLGGRASEEIFIGNISTGASDDLNKATNLANSIVTSYGMDDELGLTTFNHFKNNGEINSFYKPFSEAFAEIIDKRIQSILNEQYNRVLELLKNKKEIVYRLSDLLLERETINLEEITECIGHPPSNKCSDT